MKLWNRTQTDKMECSRAKLRFCDDATAIRKRHARLYIPEFGTGDNPQNAET
jgi:hypothetical protein